jgi:hypothetical protein
MRAGPNADEAANSLPSSLLAYRADSRLRNREVEVRGANHQGAENP